MKNKTKVMKVEIDTEHWEEFGERGLKVEEPQKTERGFGYMKFQDVYGQKCSLQNSSLATEGAIWFGIDNTGPLDGPQGKPNEEISAWMHLTRKQVEELLPYLHNFVEFGHISFEEVKKGSSYENTKA